MGALDTRAYGDIGEEYAVWLLEKNGYKILERNFRVKIGEIDIIAIDPSSSSGQVLVFVEVKTRWSRKYGRPEEAVSQRKLSKIKRTGQLYIRGKVGLPKKLRIDVVAIEAAKGNILSAKIIKVD